VDEFHMDEFLSTLSFPCVWNLIIVYSVLFKGEVSCFLSTFFFFYPLRMGKKKREDGAEDVGNLHQKAYALFCLLILSNVLYDNSPQLVGVDHIPMC